MTERTMERFINWRFCSIIVQIGIVWSLVGYWIMVSGWQTLFEFKVGVALAPVVFYTIRGIVRHISTRYHSRKRQKEILLNARVRRILDEYVA